MAKKPRAKAAVKRSKRKKPVRAEEEVKLTHRPRNPKPTH